MILAAFGDARSADAVSAMMDATVAELRRVLAVARDKVGFFTETASKAAIQHNLNVDEGRIGTLDNNQRNYVIDGSWTPAKWSAQAKLIADDINYQAGVAADSSLILALKDTIVATGQQVASGVKFALNPWVIAGVAASAVALIYIFKIRR